MTSSRIPPGTILDVGGLVRVGSYLPSLDGYSVAYSGPGHVAGARMLEAVWRRTSSVDLERLRREYAERYPAATR